MPAYRAPSGSFGGTQENDEALSCKRSTEAPTVDKATPGSDNALPARASTAPSESGTVTEQMHKRISEQAQARRAQFSDPKKKSGSFLDMGLLTFSPENNATRTVTRSYEVKEKIGSGGFGSVFKVQHKISGRLRAMKVIQKVADAKEAEFVTTELEAMIRLDHPNLAKFYEFFESATSISIISELCSGGDYSGVEWSKQPMRMTKLLFRDVLLGISYCHDQHIAHRDLKFENVLLTEGSKRKIGKIVDFGLAKCQTATETELVMNEQCGTLYFVAPEVMNSSDYGVKCDVWSFGVMLYIALTMEHPFVRQVSRMPANVVCQKVKSSKLRTAPMESLEPDLVWYFTRLLEKEPASRITASEALDAKWMKVDFDRRSGQRSCSSDSWFSLPASIFSCVGRESEDTSNDPGEPITASGTPRPHHDISSNLGTFAQLSKFEKCIMMLASHQSDSKAYEAARAQFQKIDSQKNGTISYQELQEGLAAAGHFVSEADLQACFEVVDANGDGAINYREWLMVMFPPKDLESEVAIKDLFVYFDANDDGFVSRQEICAVVGEAEAARVMEDADESHDGQLDFKEFKFMVKSIASRREEALIARRCS